MPKYGVALGGGAARGLAHIGVIKYLAEKNIRVVEISGTSMGAIVGALWAMGKTWEELSQIAKEIEYLKLIDVDWGFGFLKGDKIRSTLETYFGSTTFEDLPIPLKIVASDLDSGEARVFTSGPLIDAIRASISIPVVLAPYEIDGRLYIDGGVNNNMPIDILSTYYKIGVSAQKDIATPQKPPKKVVLGIELPDLFSSYNFQVAHKVFETVLQQNEKWSYRKATGKKQLIRFDFGDLGVTDFTKVDQFITLGYESATSQLVFEKESFIDRVRVKLGEQFY